MDEFISFAILSGCDYCNNIPKVGPITSLKLIKKYNNIDNISNNTKYCINDDYIKLHKDSINIFKSYREYDINNESFVNNLIDYHKLKSYLINDIGMNENRVKNNLKKILNNNG